MIVLVTQELLRQTFGLEAPIVAIRDADQDDCIEGKVYELVVGSEEGPQALLRCKGYGHYCDETNWYRMEYEVLE